MGRALDKTEGKGLKAMKEYDPWMARIARVAVKGVKPVDNHEDKLIEVAKIHEGNNHPIDYFGKVSYRDDAVDLAIEEGKPLITTMGDAISTREISRISQKILQSERFPVMPLDLDYYADTYELALIEAQNDYDEIQTTAKDEDDVDAGDLLAIISEQKQQINELRGTVRNLTLRGR